MLKRIEKYLFPFGMISVFFYFLYNILGNLLWTDYNAITTYISALTSEAAPNAQIIRILSDISGTCMLVMLVALVVKAKCEHNLLIQIGYATLMMLQLISTLGYALFPMKGIKLDYSYMQNVVHSVISYNVVFFTFAAFTLMGIGYCMKKTTRSLGITVLVFAFLLGIFGALYIFILLLGYNILGLSQRLIIYTIMIVMGILSYYHTFKLKNISKTE